jgi:hypothetical protein
MTQTENDTTPSELMKLSYPTASACISPLAELARVSPSLLEEVLALAMMIGIRAAEIKIERDKLFFNLDKLKTSFSSPFTWDRITHHDTE